LAVLDLNFTKLELEFAIQTAKGKSPGFDRISYPMLKNLPPVKDKLLVVFNTMLQAGSYPHTWK